MIEDKILKEDALEKLIKKNFCGMDSVVSCAYQDLRWCPENCGIYTRAEDMVKYVYWRKKDVK